MVLLSDNYVINAEIFKIIIISVGFRKKIVCFWD